MPHVGFLTLADYYYLQDRCPICPPEKSKEDILLFFKLYDPEKEELW
jgi:hypothetical protein